MRLTAPRLAAAALVAAAVPLAGCGGGGGSAGPTISVSGAKTFQLTGFKPTGTVLPGRQTTLAFTIQQPDGTPLTKYKHGPGPHTGVHVILVRSDLAGIIHNHPPIQPDGKISEPITFPSPGRYRLVVDAYPDLGPSLRNFQLFKWITVKGPAPTVALPPFKATQVVQGYTFTMRGKPALKAIQAAFLTITVRDPNGRPAVFTPWYGALAHAIFFREKTLDYFHTHVCARGASGCTATLGAAKVTGTSSAAGVLRVGVLVPLPGTWRLFLQCQVQGNILTVPFTLKVTG